MLLRQSLQTCADIVELVDFVQDRFKKHGYTALSLRSLRWEDFRWTGLVRSEDLKEEKVVTAPLSL